MLYLGRAALEAGHWSHASGIAVLTGLGKQGTLHCTGLRRFAAQSWVYPSGIAEREYQVAIVEQALLNNTLVCLPTGLGKTFIAAVVMYNFFRWFPEVCSSQDLA